MFSGCWVNSGASGRTQKQNCCRNNNVKLNCYLCNNTIHRFRLFLANYLVKKDKLIKIASKTLFNYLIVRNSCDILFSRFWRVFIFSSSFCSKRKQFMSQNFPQFCNEPVSPYLIGSTRFHRFLMAALGRY